MPAITSAISFEPFNARHFRDALWLPQLLDVSMWHDGQDAARERQMLEKANQQWREDPASWEQPDVNQDLLAEVHEVVERAKKEIAG